MDTIMISLHSKPYCDVLNKIKSLEIRGWKPKHLPCKVYAVCTQGKPLYYDQYLQKWYVGTGTIKSDLLKENNGKVLCSFMVNKLYEDGTEEELLKRACLTMDDVVKYSGKDGTIYAWEISELSIMDQPQELSSYFHNGKPIKKAPQKFIYVD